MTKATEAVLASALRLDPHERVELASELLASLDGPADPDAEDAWAAEIKRRVQALDNGAVELEPWEDVRRRMHESVKPLIAKLNLFFIEARRDGTLQKIYERYYGHVNRLEPADAEGILERRLSILPRYRKFFHVAEDETALDWRLLGAIGYQESKWDPFATSPTGVRGLMMLTAETADRMGVSDRLDAQQSIIAGAKYLVVLKDTLPERIPEPDRTWLALAAYHQGLGHLEDARRIAHAKGMNPDSWADVKLTLPLLARGGYKNVTKYGYARGGEAVVFVESVLQLLRHPAATGKGLQTLFLGEPLALEQPGAQLGPVHPNFTPATEPIREASHDASRASVRPLQAARDKGMRPKSEKVVIARSAEVLVTDDHGRERERHKVPYGAMLAVDDGKHVRAGAQLATWDPPYSTDRHRIRGHG